MFTGSFLAGVRRKALRKGIWYKALSRAERGIISLTSRLVDKIQSLDLAKSVVKILAKLRDAAKHPFTRHMENHGVSQAHRNIEHAINFGSKEAYNWMTSQYIRYLAFIDYNHGFKIV
jgi:hypothetical protein